MKLAFTSTFGPLYHVVGEREAQGDCRRLPLFSKTRLPQGFGKDHLGNGILWFFCMDILYDRRDRLVGKRARLEVSVCPLKGSSSL